MGYVLQFGEEEKYIYIIIVITIIIIIIIIITCMTISVRHQQRWNKVLQARRNYTTLPYATPQTNRQRGEKSARGERGKIKGTLVVD